MRLIVLGTMQFILWTAYYTMTTKIQDERLLLATFVVTIVITMVTASLFLAKQR